MQALVTYAIDQIALEGPQGCSIARFLQLVGDERSQEHLPAQFHHGIPTCIMEWLFETLKGRSPDITFQEEKGNQSNSNMVPMNTVPKLESLSDNKKSKIFLVASSGICDASLGLYDEQLSTFGISAVQRKTLEVVGSRRRQGALRTELARRMECDAGKLHYILKLLEARRLITQNPVIAKEDTSKIGHGIQTAIVHLRRFSPRLREGQIFTDAGNEPGKFTICDDQNRQMQHISDQLSQAKNQTLVEAELKQLLGFRKVEGHRGWRKVKAALERGGHVKSFKATFSDRKGFKAKTVIQLLKPFGIGKSEAKEEDDEDDDRPDANPDDVIAEKGFDWQVVDILAKAGRNGIAKHLICKRLGVNVKKMKKRLEEFYVRFGIIETNEQHGKQVVKKWMAPESFLAHAEEIQEGPLPKGGFVNLLQNTLTATDIPENIQDEIGRKKQGETQPSPTHLFPKSKEQKEPQRRKPAEEAVEAVLAMEDISNVVPRQEALPDRLAAEPPHEEPQAPPLLEHLPEGQALPDLPMDMLDDVSSVTVTNVGLTNPSHLTTKQTSLAVDRLDRICKKVAQVGYMLKVDLVNFFQETDAESQKTLLDKRTVMRIVDRGVATGMLQHFCIHNPQKVINMPETIFVILKPGLELIGNHARIREIRKEFVRRSTSRYRKASLLANSGPEVQHVHEITRLKPAGRASLLAHDGNDEDEECEVSQAQSMMWENGWIHARMTKARLLHTFLCKLVGLAGCSEGLSNVLEPELFEEARPEELSNLFSKREHISPASLKYSQLRKDDAEPKGEEARSAIAQAAETNKGLFTIQALWPTMPLDLFCQVVGCSNRHSTVQELILRGVPIGSLTPEENQAIVGIHAKRRLTKILVTLTKMGLISSAVYSVNTHFTNTERSIFIVRPDVSFEEPERFTNPEAAEGASLEMKFDLRAEEEVDSYWNRLEYACTEAPAEMCKLMPGRVCDDLFKQKAWTKDRMMSMSQWFKLQERMAEQVAEFGWKHCQKAADDLGLDPDQVSRIALMFRARVNRKRERLQPGDKLPRLNTMNKNSGQSKYESANVKRQTYSKRYKKTQKGWAYGVPSRSNRPILLRPWELLEKDPKKLEQAVKAMDDSDVENDEESENLNGITRKLGWTLEDDRFLLNGYVKWHLVTGFQEGAYRSQRRKVTGTSFVERQGYKRIKELEAAPKLAIVMPRLQSLIREIHYRLDARNQTARTLLKDAEDQAKMTFAAKRIAGREKKKREAAEKLAEASGLPTALVKKESELDKDNPWSRLVPFPQGKDETLFEIKDSTDEKDHAQLCEIIDDILNMAPRRADAVPSMPSPAVKRVRKRSAAQAGIADGELRRRMTTTIARPQKGSHVQHPSSTSQQLSSLHANLQRHISRKLLSRTRLLSEQRQAVTPSVAAAVELALLLMSLTEEEQQALPGSATALSRRFSKDQISSAFGYLRTHNWIFHDLKLTPDFKALSQMVDLPEDVFAEAAETVRNIESSETGIVTIALPEEEILGGAVAQVLELLGADLATLAIPPPEDFKPLLAGPVRQTAHKTTSEVDWPITADCLQGRPALPPGLRMTHHDSAEPSNGGTDTSQIMSDKAYRTQLLEQCRVQAEGSNVSANVLDRIYKKCVGHGVDGRSIQELEEEIREVSKQDWEPALRILLSCGLLTQVPGYENWVFVATEHSAPYFSDPSANASTASSSKTTEAGPDLKTKATERGEQLLAPWLDHKGNLVEKVWRRMSLHAISLILNNAGMSEEDLIAEMPTSTPMSVKRLLGALGEKHMVLSQQIQAPESELPAIFATHRRSRVQTHYFVDPRNCFSLSAIICP